MEIGIALSGGGAKGIAHLGVIKALEEHDVKIKAIAGTSAGAIAGSLHASGFTPDESLEIIIKTSFFKHLKFAASFNGLLSIDPLGKTLSKYITEDSFEKLKIKLIIAATELRRGETDYFSEGELIKPILASCCVPVIFNPYSYRDGVYVDGGILNNLPAEPLVGECEKIVGSDCNPIDRDFQLTGVKKLIERSLLLAINRNNNLSKKYCHVVIEPIDLRNFSAFDIAKARDIFDAGYRFTKTNIKSILELLEKTPVN